MPDSVVNGIFTLVVAALAGLFGYSAAISATIRKERNEAVLEFQGIFHNTLFKVDPRYKLSIRDIDISKADLREMLGIIDIIENDFEAHALAVMKFRQYIPKEQIPGFDAAWLDYHADEYEDGQYWYAAFGKYIIERDPIIKIDTDSIIKNINNILSFAKLDHKSPFGLVGT